MQHYDPFLTNQRIAVLVTPERDTHTHNQLERSGRALARAPRLKVIVVVVVRRGFSHWPERSGV